MLGASQSSATPSDAFNCFMGTDLDVLVCNNFILYKDNQNKDLLKDYKSKYRVRLI